MYDKSKKTWSQRLKISKHEKSTVAATQQYHDQQHHQQYQPQQQQQQKQIQGASVSGGGVTPNNASQAQGSISSRNMQAMHLQALHQQQKHQHQQQQSHHQQQLSEYHHGPPGLSYEFLPSALSRSMKYAEPWIYGTVRGIPARPTYHHQLMAAGYHHGQPHPHHGHPHPHAAAIFAGAGGTTQETTLAVVICSCPEYLNGTKRDVKKASVCKKCKGSRLPLATIGTGGGTVRLPASTAALALAGGVKLRGAATMRVVSTTKKSRPTILDPQKDPYDLMRRTRLLSPEPGGLTSVGGNANSGNNVNTSNSSSTTTNTKDAKSRSRGKSASPQRGRSRTRSSLTSAKVVTPNKDTLTSSEQQHKNNNNTNNMKIDDGWMVDDNESLLSASLSQTSHSRQHSRRSILRCNVNPYDLISFEEAATITSIKKLSSSKPMTLSSRVAVTASPTSPKLASQNEFLAPNNYEFNVADAALHEDEPPFAIANNQIDLSEQERKFYTKNVQAIAGQRISLGDQRSSKKTFIKQTSGGDSRKNYENIIIATTTVTHSSSGAEQKMVMGTQQQQQHHQQQRQPLKQQQQQQQQQQQPKRPPRLAKKSDNGNDNSATLEVSNGTTRITISETTTTKDKVLVVNGNDDDDNDNSDEAEDDDIDATITVLTVTPTQSIKSILKRPTSLEIGHTPLMDKGTEILATPLSTSSSLSVGSTPTSGGVILSTPTSSTKSQFYIPMPTTSTTRKKVQFMVEDEDNIIQATAATTTTTIADNAVIQNGSSSNNNNSNSNKKNNYLATDNDFDVNENFADNNDDDDVDVDDEHNNDDDDIIKEFEHVEYATRGANYEYYNRKREQQKLLKQQQQAATIANSNVKSTNDNDQHYVVDNDDDGDDDGGLHEKKEEMLQPLIKSLNTFVNKAQENNSPAATAAAIVESAVDEDGDGVGDDDDGNLVTATNTKADSLHYEDVFIPVATQQIFNNNNRCSSNINTENNINNNKSNGTSEIMSSSSLSSPDTNTKLLLLSAQSHAGSSSSKISTIKTTPPHIIPIVNFNAAPPSATSKAGATTTTVDGDNHHHDDADADDATADVSSAADNAMLHDTVVDTSKVTTRPEAKAKSTSTKNPVKRSDDFVVDDNDDDDNMVRQKLLQSTTKAKTTSGRKMSETSATSTTRKSSVNMAQPQTRNPIRRAHSERHLSLPAASSSSSTLSSYDPAKQHQQQQQQPQIGSAKHHSSSGSSSTNERKSQQTNVILNFKDTMALRIKNNRNDSRDLFQRPKEPPPPPPPPTPATPPTTELECKNVENGENQKQIASDNQQKQKQMMATNGLDHKEQQLVKQRNQRPNSLPAIAGTTTRTNTTKCHEINSPNFEMNFVNMKSRQDRQKQQQQQQQRTVVRVAPFNKTSSEVHRLKISHTDHADDDDIGSDFNNPRQLSPAMSSPNVRGDQQKKTSILINGDDCYSTMNLSSDTAPPLYQSSVVVADATTPTSNSSDGMYEGLSVRTNTTNTVTINVCSPKRTAGAAQRSSEEELIYQHNKINTLLSRQALDDVNSVGGVASVKRAIIPIKCSSEVNLQRSASSTSSTSTSSIASTSSSGSTSTGSTPKRGRTLIRLDYEKEKQQQQQQQQQPITATLTTTSSTAINSPMTAVITPTTPKPTCPQLVSHEAELLKILRNPVEAVKRNLVPHICGRHESASKDIARAKKMKDGVSKLETSDALSSPTSVKPNETHSFIAKLLEDPTLGQVADGLEPETIAELIENSLKRLQSSRMAIDITGTKDSDDMNRLISLSLQKIKEERNTTNNVASSNSTNSQLLAVPTATTTPTTTSTTQMTKEDDRLSNRGSISSANSFASAHNYEMFDFDANESDCYQSCSSELASAGVLEDYDGEDSSSLSATRSRFYQMLVDATLAEIEHSTHNDADVEHHYESIRHNGDPIYEEIGEVPPPLPLTAPPLNDPELEKKAARSIFEGASKYDILSYLVDAKERGLVREETLEYPQNTTNPIIIEEEATDTLSDLDMRKHQQDRSSRASILSDSSEDNQSTMSSLSPPPHNFICGGSLGKGAASDIERNDSGVGSETSKTSRSKFQQQITATSNSHNSKNSPLHLCEDCDGSVETQMSDSGVMFAPLVCRKCGKKRVERKEIITEIVETEEKYGRDLQIILEEFCHPMLVAGLLTQEQLSAIFLNTEELLENNQTLAERMRDALDISLEQGDDDLLTVNIGRIFLDFTQMLHAFESYCVRQAGASLLLANLEKEKELLRIFLKVSQMENAVLRRMNLNSFLMVPVQRVTKYPLLLARLYKVTPSHLEGRDLLKQSQEKIELHLNHINQEAKDVPTKLWRRISSSSPNRRASCEIDMINIKLRKMAIDILEWNHDEVRFVLEGKLLYTQPTDSNWKKARTIKLTPVNALLVTNGKPSANYKAEKVMSDKLNFPKHTGIREASLLVVKEKCGRYTLIREPLYLDRCVVCSEADWDDYFEVQEISSKDTFIFKAEDGVRTKQWYTQLQYHAQGMGAWRKRRNALANIMINGMLTRS